MSKKDKNTYKMWPNGPDIVLPDEYHFNSETQQIVKNDLTWSGDLMAFWKHQKEVHGE